MMRSKLKMRKDRASTVKTLSSSVSMHICVGVVANSLLLSLHCLKSLWITGSLI